MSSLYDTKSRIEVDDGHSMMLSANDHPVHLLPLSSEGVELKDVIIVGVRIVITA